MICVTASSCPAQTCVIRFVNVAFIYGSPMQQNFGHLLGKLDGLSKDDSFNTQSDNSGTDESPELDLEHDPYDQEAQAIALHKDLHKPTAMHDVIRRPLDRDRESNSNNSTPLSFRTEFISPNSSMLGRGTNMTGVMPCFLPLVDGQEGQLRVDHPTTIIDPVVPFVQASQDFNDDVVPFNVSGSHSPSNSPPAVHSPGSGGDDSCYMSSSRHSDPSELPSLLHSYTTGPAPKRVKTGSPIGRGAFGTVYLGLNVDDGCAVLCFW